MPQVCSQTFSCCLIPLSDDIICDSNKSNRNNMIRNRNESVWGTVRIAKKKNYMVNFDNPHFA